MDSYWKKLKKPIIGLSPMDGVTDAAFRFIADKYGKPDILITEFTSVEGISRGAVKLLEAFVYHKTSTPTVAQIFGSHPEDFYKVAVLLCEMGFDGIDINMGCPDANVAKKGGGAALILRPDLAQEIIRSTKQAVKDWSEGKQITETGLPDSITGAVHMYNKTHGVHPERRLIPISVKTRIGYEEIVTKDWISTLLETEPANISIHGRTLKQMYTGSANWEQIGIAAELVKKTQTCIMGNGDVKTVEDGKLRAKQYNLDGVLIGRAALGNPWIFKSYKPTIEERIKVALEHCEVFTRLTPDAHFLSLRKHLAWYIKGIEGAHELRRQLMTVHTLLDVKKTLSTSLITNPIV